MDVPSKKEMVREMFDDISPRYDLLNHLLSFGIDRIWRRKLVNLLGSRNPETVLDVATGTGDLAIAISKLNPHKIVGIDISEKMLEIGRRKLVDEGLNEIISLVKADAENIPFANDSFDAITVAFGVRNYEDLEKGLTEMHRVLRPGGIMLILEFSHPPSFPVKQFYSYYSRYMIPLLGRFISGNKMAYNYLPESVAAFPSGEQFLEILQKPGMKNTRQISLSMGIASIYVAEK